MTNVNRPAHTGAALETERLHRRHQVGKAGCAQLALQSRLVEAFALEAREAFEPELAFPLASKALQMARRAAPEGPGWSVSAMNVLGSAHEASMEFDSAIGYRRAVLAIWSHIYGSQSPEVWWTKLQLARTLHLVEDGGEATTLEAEARQAMRARDVAGVASLRDEANHLLARSSIQTGRPDLGLPVLEARAEAARAKSSGTLAHAQAERELSEVQLALGKYEAARQSAAAAETAWRNFANGAQAPRGDVHYALARAAVEAAAGRPELALELLPISLPALPYAALKRDLVRARAQLRLGRPTEALAAAEGVLAHLDARPVGRRPVVLAIEALQLRGAAQRAKRDLTGARASLQRALDLARAHDASSSLRVAELRRTLAALIPG